MTDRPDPPLRVLRSLPLAILLGTAVCVIGWPLVHWLSLLTFREAIPSWQVWTDYLAVRAIVGVCVGAAAYAVGRLPEGWLRWCLYWFLLFFLLEGDVDDFARWSLGYWLSVWLLSSLIAAMVIGTLTYAVDRRKRVRTGA